MDQQSNEWFTARLGKVTASRVDGMASGAVGRTFGNPQELHGVSTFAVRLTGKREEGFTSGAMARGTELERRLMTHRDVMVLETRADPSPTP